MSHVRHDKLTLAIEMSNPSMWADPLRAGEIALGAVDAERLTILGVEPITLRSPRDDALAPAIDRLLRRVSVDVRDLERIAVSAGPGGFTSVRLAVTTAKVMAEAIGAGVVIVPTGEAVARTIRSGKNDPGTIAVTLAGKRETAWCAVYEPDDWDNQQPAPTIEGVMTAAAFAATAQSGEARLLIADAHTPAGFRAWAERTGVETAATRSGARAVLEAALFIDPVDPVAALPIYPREPEAVTKWRDRHG